MPLQGQGESVTYTDDGTKLLYGSEGSDSSVQAEDAPGGSSSGASKSPSVGGSSASGDDGSATDGKLKVGVVAVAVVAAVFGLRRLFRRN